MVKPRKQKTRRTKPREKPPLLSPTLTQLTVDDKIKRLKKTQRHIDNLETAEKKFKDQLKECREDLKEQHLIAAQLIRNMDQEELGVADTSTPEAEQPPRPQPEV